MVLPDLSVLTINGAPPVRPIFQSGDDFNPDDHSMRKLQAYASSLPYSIEPLSKMMEMLDFIILRIVQCVEAKDFEVGLIQWDKIAYSQLSWCLGYIAENARRFFSPSAIEEMLSTFVPLIDGTKLDSILAPQYYLLTFLPLTHPQSYLPMLFRMWESINSYMYDERMLHFLSKIAEMHVNPTVSDPRKIAELPDDERVEGEDRPYWSPEEVKDEAQWTGLYKDVGIFSEHEWHLFMCKCLGSMEIPLADAGSLTTGPNADNQAGFEIGRLPKPSWRIVSLARIIVYSMAPDGVPVPASNAPTPLFSPLPSGMNTPQVETSTLKEFLSAPLGRKGNTRTATYLAGSKALDSLARLIASTESFFHPSNSGAWTNDGGTKNNNQTAKHPWFIFLAN
ncbi:hypothetical protein H0H81_005550 [Sphagnurus paluster]|uniref:Uncharacterized protein n=1 Tax=Sphagnurus paluster TaxID=117069 RepID=A0A9P7KL33_9AGAR|nr:hypothetical protein H0H81_005550 [Sphagnurus paluster]